jgi:hypothetical protein
LPGRSPEEARKAFLQPLQRALSCITDAKLLVSRGKQPGDVEALALSEDPLQLTSARIGPVQFALGHQFRLINDGRKAWHVSTTAYRYHLLDESGAELVGWHWHPDSLGDFRLRGHPHLHVPAGSIDRRVHVPTGRVSIESVLRLLLVDLAVPPRPAHVADFATVLQECEEPFIRHRRWHAWWRGQ